MRKSRLLFVDDEPDLLETFQDVWGYDYQVATACGGAEGLQALAEFAPDVVISDMRMPDMDGATFLAQVRDRAPQTVRVLLTGHADVDAAMRAINDGGVFRFLTKPCPTDQLREVLEAAVEKRTAQVRTDRLATLGTLSATFSHEMRNSLSLMACAISELEEQTADQETIRMLVNGRDRLIAQAHSVMSLSRGAVRETRGPSSIDVAEVIGTLVGELATAGIARHIAIEVDAPRAQIARIRATDLEQILINLIKNAIDAMPKARAKPRIMISCRSRGDHVAVAVGDNGSGIAAEHLKRVFEPHFTTKADGGNGLGLPLVKRLVERTGGRVLLESTPGAGTTVTLELPTGHDAHAHAHGSV